MNHDNMLGSALVCAMIAAGSVCAQGAAVKFSVPSQAPSLTVTHSGGGTPATLVEEDGLYTADLPEGRYVAALGLTVEGEGTAARGTIDFTVTGEPEQQFDLCLVRGHISNKNQGADYFMSGVDFNLTEVLVMEQLGAKHEVSYVETEENGMACFYFPMFRGNTYSVTATPTEEHSNLAPKTVSATVTASYNQCPIAMEMTGDFTLTVPKEAIVSLGYRQRSYRPITEHEYTSREESGDNYIYHYAFSNNMAVLYSIQLPGYMAHRGKMGINQNLTSMTFTREYLQSHGTPDYVNRDLTFNQNGNLADLLLTGNERNHICLKPGDTKVVTPQRVWQLIDDQSNNTYVEPDYHFTVLNENFEEGSDVIEIEGNGKVTAKKAGTAIVLVDYDACFGYIWNNNTGFAAQGVNLNLWFGSLWSKLWAENTGVFVVSVGDSDEYPDNETFKPNFMIAASNPSCTGRAIDCELDSFYYLESEEGFFYTFSPEGASAVEIARPDVDIDANTVSYTPFTSDRVVKNDDGSYTVFLSRGRNILRVKSAEDDWAYQVLTARPLGYTVENKTHDDGKIHAGDDIEIQFRGFYHPTPKLASIYNQSANVYFSAVNNNGSLILGPGQYTFAGDPRAQLIKTSLPADFDKESFDLVEGAVFVRGYGSVGGVHRKIDPEIGTNPNFTAKVTSQYWGDVPEIKLPVEMSKGGVILNGIPEGYTVELKSADGKSDFYQEGKTKYTLAPGTYNYAVKNGSLKLIKGTVEVADEYVEINLAMPTGGIKFEDVPEIYRLQLLDSESVDITLADTFEYVMAPDTYTYVLWLGELKVMEQSVEVGDEIVTVKVSLPRVGVSFDVDDDVEIRLMDARGRVNYTVEGVREYVCVPGTYSYYAGKPGHLVVEKEVEVTDGMSVVKPEFTATPDGAWDGESLGVPVRVTAADVTANEALDGYEGFYKIEKGSELAWFAQKSRNFIEQTVPVSAVLTADIDLGDKDWTPIGDSYSEYFYGTFDGLNHEIKNLRIESLWYNGGLFNKAVGNNADNSYSLIQNLTVDGNLTLYQGAPIVNQVEKTILRNLTNRANIFGTNVAGIVYCANERSYSAGDEWTMLRNYGDISGNNVSGLIGQYHPVNLSRLENHGSVTGTGTYGAAFALVNSYGNKTVISDSYNTGKVSYTQQTSIPGFLSFGDITARNLFNIAENAGEMEFAGYVWEPAAEFENIFFLCDEKAGSEGMDLSYENPMRYEYISTDHVSGGELAWRLGAPFGQKLGEDVHPVLDGDAVHRILYTIVKSNEASTREAMDEEDLPRLYVNSELPETVEGTGVTWYKDPECTEPMNGNVSEDMRLYAKSVVAGIDLIQADSEYEWYTLDGLRVERPGTAGVYIRVRNGEAEKITVK